ncbi:hypothetical protein A5722_14865 [Mycobacterium vulneris]|nr:hypothetical protein A5722_14865 [Mycolicibacterium vulneris]OCB66210.1 hypothetical protein A5729_12370 [Mycolicibacterium vulneris]
MTTTFLDTETLGLDRRAPIWEFAAIRIEDDGTESAREHFQIRHQQKRYGIDWAATLPEWFQRDYQARYRFDQAIDMVDAADRIAKIVAGKAVIAGSNPGFDMERLGDLLAEFDIEPEWHYHPLDVPTIAVGWLTGIHGRTPPRPWKSDELTRLVGLDPDEYKRHTALGDVEWCRDLYESITDGDTW